MLDTLPWLIVVLPAFALVLTLLNAVWWPRGRRGEVDVRVSVLIPARDEQANIERTVRAALAQPVDEVLVYDDQSTDDTVAILEALAREDSRVQVLRGVTLPPGWVGKPHACHRLAHRAIGEVLLFLDADVALEPHGVEHLCTVMRDFDADVVTAVPRQRFGGFVERLVIPMLHVTYASWLPLPLVWRTADPRFLAANGQILAVRRAAYDVAGFDAVRDAVVDDMAICAAQKRAGHRVVFADGHLIASCRMYRSAGEVWRGFSKNVFEGLGSPAALFLAITLYLATFVAPWAALVAGDVMFWPALVGVGANVTQRAVLLVRHRHPVEGLLLVPVATMTLGAIAVNSWVWHLRNDIQWSGRSYPRKRARRG